MGKITESKHKMQKKAEQVIVEEIMRRLETAIKLREQGKDVEGDKVVNDMKDWLKELKQQMEKALEPETPPVIERSDLPQNGEVVVVGNKVILGVLREDEKEMYLAVSAEYSYLKGVYKDEKLREGVWNDFLSDSTFVCSIYDKVSGEYVGYCSIKNLVKNDWELAIELMPDACHKGYGTEALSLLMQVLHRLTGRRYFRARVEIEKFQEENKGMITDEIRAVAAEFGMAAEDILGYVLEYRFDVENLKGVMGYSKGCC